MSCRTPYRAITAGTTIDQKTYSEDVLVPCGKCSDCKKRRVFSWVFRLQEEDKVSSSSYFITLTYETLNLPVTKNGLFTLDHEDFQKFMKKLRKKQPWKEITDKKGKVKRVQTKLKYYMVGEYGEKRKRPHYHVILFNLENTDNIADSWSLGSHHIGQVSGASIAYTANYIDKETRIPEFHTDDRKKEYSNMSQGLGKSYLSQDMKEYHKLDITRTFASRVDGIKIPLPRYYLKELYTDKEREKQIEHIKQKMIDQEALNELEYKNIHPDSISYKKYQEKKTYELQLNKRNKKRNE